MYFPLPPSILLLLLCTFLGFSICKELPPAPINMSDFVERLNKVTTTPIHLIRQTQKVWEELRGCALVVLVWSGY